MSKHKKTILEHAHQRRLEKARLSVQKIRLAVGIGIIVLTVFVVYFPSLNGGFILDDDKLLTDNDLVKTPDGLYRFWCTTESLDYWPVSNTSLWIEWHLWGMHPAGYHLTNLALHIASSLLIWQILRKLYIQGAFFAALIFAIHPVNVEAVAWIAQRKGLLAIVFFLLSILYYLKFEIPLPLNSAHCPLPTDLSSSSTVHRPLFYWLSLVMFLLAMLSKGSVAMLPLVLLGIIWWLRSAGAVSISPSAKIPLSPLFSKWDFIRIAPFFLVAVMLAVVDVWFQRHGTETVIRTAGFFERLLGAGCVVWFYLYKALLPGNLMFVYTQWQIQPTNVLWWLPLVAAIFLTAILWLYREKWSRAFLFAWGFFCVSLMPVMGFTDVGFMEHSLVADHYQHLAIIGVIALTAAGWGTWHERVKGSIHRPMWVVAIVAVVGLTFLACQQSSLYHDALTLYQATLKKNPNSWLAHNNLAHSLIDMQRLQEGIEHCRQALRLNPAYPEAQNNLGVALGKLGRMSDAIEHFRQSLQINPYYAEARNNLGVALGKLGQTQEAIDQFEQTLHFKPYFSEAQNNLGNALFLAGQPQEAIKHYQQALRLDPNNIQAQNNLGKVLGKVGRLTEAIDHFKIVLQLKPDLIETYANLAWAYALTDQLDDAIHTAEKGLEIARSQGQTTMAKKIEYQLDSYRARLSGPPITVPSQKKISPPP